MSSGPFHGPALYGGGEDFNLSCFSLSPEPITSSHHPFEGASVSGWPWLAGTRPTLLASDLLPELYHGAGHVGGVDDAVVGEAAVGVPGVVTLFPRQCLQRHSGTDKPC